MTAARMSLPPLSRTGPSWRATTTRATGSVPADLDALRQLRHELRLIFGAFAGGSADDAAARLNALLARHPIHPEIARHDDQAWHLHHATSGSVADQYAAGAVLGLTRVITELGAGRLRHCEAAACSNSFVDLTAAGSQGHCGDRCAATANVTALHEQGAAYRRRTGQREATPAAGLTGSAAGRRCPPALPGRATPLFGSRRSGRAPAPRVTTWTDRNPRYRNESATFFSGRLTIITMRPTHGAYAPRMRTGKRTGK